MLKSGLLLPDNYVLYTSLLLMLTLCGNESLEWIIHPKSDLVMSFVYLLYVIECVVHIAPCLMVCMELSTVGMFCPFAHIFKLSGLMCYLK